MVYFLTLHTFLGTSVLLVLGMKDEKKKSLTNIKCFVTLSLYLQKSGGGGPDVEASL